MFTCPKLDDAGPFHVSIHDHPEAFVLKLEGRFAAADAPAVEARWRTGASMIGSRAFVVDLSSASVEDAAARELLSSMRQSGAALVAGPPASRRPSFHRLRIFFACLLARLLGML